MRAFKVGVFFMSVLLLTGLSVVPVGFAQEKPQYGGILRVALAADPPSLDMHQEQTFAVAQPMGPLYNTLIVFDPHHYPEIIGDLAKSWTASADHLTHTFTLHAGVKFHDGSELTSADVKASWDRIVFPPEGVVSPRRSNYQMIKSIEAPDRSTVVFRLHHPSPPFLTSLAAPHNFIYAKKYLDADPHYYKTRSVGTGPFKLKNVVRGSIIELERNPAYWKQGLPYLDRIEFKIMKDGITRGTALRAGEVDCVNYVPKEMVARLSKDPKIQVLRGLDTQVVNISFNNSKKPFDDVRVRQALGGYGIERQAIAKTALLGLAKPLWSFVPPGGKDHIDFADEFPYNPQKAKALLKEAGFDENNPLRYTIITNQAEPSLPTVATIIKTRCSATSRATWSGSAPPRSPSFRRH